jgi:alanine racemase
LKVLILNNFSNNRACIDLKRLGDNFERIKAMAPHSEQICVVKADAYGHGADECAKTLCEHGCRSFAVAQLGEAVALRETLGNSCDILILGSTPPQYADILAEHRISQALYSLEYAKALSECLDQRHIVVHIKVDTGMNRIGFGADEEGAAEAVKAARLPGFDVEGVFSHFACADEPGNPKTKLQLRRFETFVSALRQAGVQPRIRHICASSGIIDVPEAHFEAVRPGVILYGMQPADTMVSVRSLGLLPVMRLESRVVHLHRVAKGETISYGGTYKASQDMEVATLPIGYGDGFVRAYSGGSVEIGGEKRPIVGRICMDQCMVDVSGLEVRLFDTVGIFTDDNPVEAFAARAKTINYECTCLLNSRVPRVYSGK